MSKIEPYIFIDGHTGETYCERCGYREKLKLPVSVDAFIKWSEYFSLSHKDCKEVSHER